jgi:hypothetical protein
MDQMFEVSRSSVSLVGPALVAAILAVFAPSALASGPATVTVRAYGADGQTVIANRTVTTTETHVYGENSAEHTCSGTSAAGALQQATNGEWAGTWEEPNGYFLTGIDTESLTLPSYWNLWVNNKPATERICDQQLESGDHLLFFADCPSKEGETCSSSPPRVLVLEAPATTEVHHPTQVTVLSYPASGCAAGEEAPKCPTPIEGAIVSGGDKTELTGPGGLATVEFSDDDTYPLRATGPEEGTQTIYIPGEATVCAHDGNDGTCGTKLPPSQTTFETPASSGVTGGSPSKTQSLKNESSIIISATGLVSGRRYSSKAAPRMLSGAVFSTSPVTSISIRLRRTWKGRCYAFNGRRHQWQHVGCSKQASYFKIGHDGSSFSYLLPSRLPAGRYIFDVKATNSAGDHTTLKGGTSQIVFYVK